MTDKNNTTNQKFKVCACINCQKQATRLMEVNYIYKKGWFCDTCAIDLSFHGIGKEIFDEEMSKY